ncbi:MAG: cobamide remodeling phosphodiesterase CbiR [Desulfovermiculus sp.]|nr:cobamide remodeling phosphodiesterase CbiR [Desulfovermiculus sp.]
MTASPGSKILPASPWPIAAPSFVWPARVGENCRRLHGMVDEAALVFFQTQGCLEYDLEDLPPWMADLNLSYHLHLPLDLPWEQGGKAAAQRALALADKVAFCQPWGFVLHPPRDPKTFLSFHRHWCDHGLPSSSLILENVEHNDLIPLLPSVAETDCRICLDFGHLVAYGQWALLQQNLVRNRLSMLHVYAPVGGHSHKGLTHLSLRDQDVLMDLLPMLPTGGVVVLEVFSWPDLQGSLDIFSLWIRNWDSIL